MVGDGFKVSQYLPVGIGDMERLSPFLLLDYHAPHYYEPSSTIRGVGAHPHRGFETVTIAYNGKVEHHDNKGNHGIIGPGDVQWMTAASGILHKEYHETEFSKKGVKGPADTFTDINIYNVTLNNNGRVSLNEPSNFNTGILVLKGEIKINGENVGKESDFILFDNVEGSISVEAITKDALFIVLSGRPINEPVVSHGPFVMNTIEEIYQAYDDFRNNKFGSEEF